MPKKFKQYFPVLSISIFAFIVSLRQISSFDYWTHLALGRAFWEAKSISIVEPFLQHSKGSPITSFHWPFQVILYLVQKFSGHFGSSIFVALIVAATFALLWKFVSADADTFKKCAAWSFLALVLLTSRERFVPRPEILGCLIAAAALPVSYSWRERPSFAKLIILGAMLFLWALVHASWTIGLVLFLCPIVLWPRLDFWIAIWRKRTGKIFVFAGSACFAFSTFYTFDFAKKVFQALTQGGALGSITEMLPMWTFPKLAMYYGMIFAVGFVLSWGGSIGRIKRLCLWGIALALGGLVVRNIALACLALVAPALDGLRSWQSFSFSSKYKSGQLLVPLSIAIIVFFISFVDSDLKWGVGVRWEFFPRDAAQFVKDKKLPSPVFNTLDIGGYLDWAWGGEPPTFIDGRVMGDSSVFRDLNSLCEADAPSEILNRLGIRTVVMRSFYLSSARIFPIYYWLLHQSDWRLVRATDALVFVRDPLPFGVVEISHEKAWRYVLWETDIKSSIGGNEPHLNYSRGVAFYSMGDIERSRDAFTDALSLHPEWANYYARNLIMAGLTW